ncbi:50S ribosomal protein L22 [Candidatus Woesearchaeota archaeon]|nr:50S ribosomal protein L22 [Candidatus Woesearchaeota archaeon]
MKGHVYTNYSKEHMARAIGTALPISFKQSVEICRFIKDRKISEAKKILYNVIERRAAIPFKRYNWDLGHKKKIGPASYPEKASKEFIRLIESAEANAQFKGLNTSNLVIAHISAHKAGKAWHFGRKTRRKMKRTNIEIVIEEKKKGEAKAETKAGKIEMKNPTEAKF